MPKHFNKINILQLFVRMLCGRLKASIELFTFERSIEGKEVSSFLKFGLFVILNLQSYACRNPKKNVFGPTFVRPSCPSDILQILQRRSAIKKLWRWFSRQNPNFWPPLVASCQTLARIQKFSFFFKFTLLVLLKV